jgi:hypothetical protein
MRSSLLILAGALALLGSTTSMGQIGGVVGSCQADTDVQFFYNPQGGGPGYAPTLEIEVNGWFIYVVMVPDRWDDDQKGYEYIWHIPPGITGEIVRWKMIDTVCSDHFTVH